MVSSSIVKITRYSPVRKRKNCSVPFSGFTSPTGLQGCELTGALTLTYSDITNVNNPDNLSTIDVLTDNNGKLYIQSSVAETVQIYLANGVLLYNFQKQAGKTSYQINQFKGTVLIVKGSSGWTRKVILD